MARWLVVPALFVVAAGAVLLAVAAAAEASHYRGGTLWWSIDPIEPEIPANASERAMTIRVGGEQVLRWSALASPRGSPPLCSGHPGQGLLQISGHPGLAEFQMVVTEIDRERDMAKVRIVDVEFQPEEPCDYPPGPQPDLDASFTLPVPLLEERQTITWEACCRLGTLGTQDHINNPEKGEKMTASFRVLDLDRLGDPNVSPHADLPFIRLCPVDQLCAIPVQAADRNGDTLRYRLARPDETAPAGDNFHQPGPACLRCPGRLAALRINGETGVMFWDTTGALDPVGPGSDLGLYSVQAMVEDEMGGVPLDFMIETYREPEDPSVPAVVPQARVLSPTPCDATLRAVAGSRFQVEVAGRTDTEGVPAGLTVVGEGARVVDVAADGQYVDASVAWASVPAGLHEVLVVAWPEEGGGADSCRFYIEGVAIDARFKPGWDGPEGWARLVDESAWHDDVHERTWTWHVGGAPVGTGETWTGSLAEGEHTVCLVIAGSYGGVPLEDRACRPMVWYPLIQDEDEDGVQDHADNCPHAPNRKQEDADHDGRGDACDEAPLDPAIGPTAGGAGDLDEDGIPDGRDNCPTILNPMQEDMDHDSHGDACDPDIDGDRVPNGIDHCPLTPDPGQGEDGGVGIACRLREDAAPAQPRVASPDDAGAPERSVAGPALASVATVLSVLVLFFATWRRDD